MVATIAAGTVAGYYLAQSEYYLGGSELPGTWIAAGDRFGIAAGEKVERESFERLHAALGPDRKPLLTNGGRLDRVPGYDITFSAPKSVSVLWALSDPDLREKIEAAQERAVKAAIALLERNAAWSRRGRGGIRSERVELTAAAFMHGEARPAPHEDGSVFADPQLHTHTVILNLARREDGTVGALDGRRLFAWKMAAGAAYHLELASGLQALGLVLRDTGKNGVFEIAGVDETLCRYFSARRGEIEALLDEAGTHSAAAPALAASIAKASRSAKTIQPSTDRHALWRERAASRGVEVERLAADPLQVGNASADVVEKPAPPPQPLAEIAAELTRHQSYFDRRQLVAAVATALVGSGTGAADAEREADGLVAAGDLVELRPDAIGERRYSTPEMIRIEREVLDLSMRLAAAPARNPEAERLKELAEEQGLSKEQTEAMLSVARQGRVAIMEGAAGSGKTTTLRPLVQAFQDAGLTVIGSATAWRIANQLGADLGVVSRATDSWIARRQAGTRFADPNTVLIVDEAGQLSSRQMHALLAEAVSSGARLVLVGDRRQLQPVGAGGALSIVARAVEVAEVRRVVRQREKWARSAVMALMDGRAGSALKTYERKGLLHYANGARKAAEGMVDAAEEGSFADPGQMPLLLARTNADVRRINGEIRRRRRERGLLRGEDIIVTAVTPSGHGHDLHLAAGDHIRFLARNDRLGVVNGSTATLTVIKLKDDAVRLTARIGDREVTFEAAEIADAAGRLQLGHAYASTFYGAQGLTSEQAFVLLDPFADRHDAYVALSRSRGETRIFVDRTAIDAAMRESRQLSRRTAAPEKDDANRTKWLGRQLSRSAIKGTTLDLIVADTDPAGKKREVQPRLDRGPHLLAGR